MKSEVGADVSGSICGLAISNWMMSPIGLSPPDGVVITGQRCTRLSRCLVEFLTHTGPCEC
jgi:hypothetical protein